MTRPSPELFGLIDATSNAGGEAAVVCGACAVTRDTRRLLATSAAGTQASAAATIRRRRGEVGWSVEAVCIGTSACDGRIIRLDTRLALLAGQFCAGGSIAAAAPVDA